VLAAVPLASPVPAVATALRDRLPGRLPPEHAALLVAGEAEGFALTGTWAGVAAVVGVGPLVTLGVGEDPFSALDRLPALDGGSDPGCAIGGGWFGALGYALAAAAEPTVPGPPAGLGLAPATLAFYDHVLVCDHKGGWWFEALDTPARHDALRRRRAELADRLATAPRPRSVRLHTARWRAPGPAGHRRAVAVARERIAAGEIFQANLCLRLDATLEGRAADLAAAAAHALAPAHGALVVGGGASLVSASPELFLRRRGREVRTRPIKGTAPEGGGADALADSAKDRAEHVMIVDLMRNDLGRVCAYGSVHVSALAVPEPGAGVQHLVSDVTGTLRPGVGDAELLRATFPPGSVTGAPKVQALRVIAELEAAGREAYTGALGYASPVAGLELSVVIRTFELRGARVQLGVGGGITTGSDPEAELEECRVKAAPLLALGGAEVPAAHPAGACDRGRDLLAGLPRALADGRRRPDPASGLLETLLVRDGEPQAVEAHLARLTASAAALGLAAPPADLRSRIEDETARGGDARLRVVLGGDGAATVTAGPLPDGEALVLLHPVVLPGGLGPHKWADRRLLDALARKLGGVPLLIDGDGTVLEAAWANVWVQEAGRLTTPRADGRLLPGIARDAALATGEAHHEGDLDLDRVRAADALWVTSALRRVQAQLAPAASSH
jgi:para-aminobenzoate synthetase / 4-amino-4-deoxychorismate lyase